MKMSIVSKFFPALFLAFFSVAALNAQTENAPAGKPQLQKAERQRKHDDRMAKELNLTPEQRAHFKKTDEEYKSKNKATRAARKEESAQLRAERIKAHKSVLNSEQAAKYDQIMARKQAKHETKAGKKARHKAAKEGRKAEKKAIKKELDKQ